MLNYTKGKLLYIQTKFDIINLYLVVQWTLVKIEGYNNCFVMIKRKCIIVCVNLC